NSPAVQLGTQHALARIVASASRHHAPMGLQCGQDGRLNHVHGGGEPYVSATRARQRIKARAALGRAWDGRRALRWARTAEAIALANRTGTALPIIWPTGV